MHLFRHDKSLALARIIGLLFIIGPSCWAETDHAAGVSANSLTGPGMVAATIHREDWLLRQNPNNYTIQLISLQSEATLANFINAHNLAEGSSYFFQKTKGGTLYSLLYGIYDSQAAAKRTLDRLPPELHKTGPWIRTIGQIQKLIRNEWPASNFLGRNHLPKFTDDGDLNSLEEALARQLTTPYSARIDENLIAGQYQFGVHRLVSGNSVLLALVRQAGECLQKNPTRLSKKKSCLNRFYDEVLQRFYIYRPRPVDKAKRPNVTAYYTPTVRASSVRQPPYVHPIYRTPARKYQRLTRHQIDFEGKLRGHGYELFYTASLYDNYILQIEGGGKLDLIDPPANRATVYLIYHSDNDRPCNPVDETMVREGMLTEDNTSRRRQRRYLERHPEKAQAIFSECPYYAYFQISSTPPVGNQGAILTGGRSIATDSAYYPVKGMLAYVETWLPMQPPGSDPKSNPPIAKHRKFQRFVVDQDVGISVRGPSRLDIYFGEGAQAEFLANNLHTYGDIYFLILK